MCVKKTSETESRASGDTDPIFDDHFQSKWWKQGSAIFFPVELFLLNDDDPVAVATFNERCRDVKTRVLNTTAHKNCCCTSQEGCPEAHEARYWEDLDDIR